MHQLSSSAGVIVDLDDTLYSERSFHESGFRQIARLTGLDPFGPEVEQSCLALRSGGAPLDSLSTATGIAVSELLRLHRHHRPEISLFPDAKRFLQLLREWRIPIVLLTDGRSATQRSKIASLGIADIFSQVLISEETSFTKLDREAFELAASHLIGRSPLVYFGDNPAKDVDIPSAMGWQVYLLLDRGDNVHPQNLSPDGTSGNYCRLSSFDAIVPVAAADSIGGVLKVGGHEHPA